MKKCIKCVSLNEKHIKFIEDNTLNFSKFVRKKIEEEMEKNAKGGERTGF